VAVFICEDDCLELSISVLVNNLERFGSQSENTEYIDTLQVRGSGGKGVVRRKESANWTFSMVKDMEGDSSV
jgi:hypothetical protein